MAVTVKQRSRLRFHELVTLDGYEYWELSELPTIPVQPDDIQLRVKGTDRIDLLAHQYYGDAVLWWVIAKVNDIDLIPVHFHEGMVIRIPSPTYVNQQLFIKAEF